MFRTGHPAELGDLVEVEVVGDDLAAHAPRQLDELQVHLADLREVGLHDLHRHVGHLLDLLQDVEAAAAAVALQRVRRVGHLLQLAEDELRRHQRAVQEPGLADVGDAPVDDHRGVEDLVVVQPRGVAEGGDHPRGLEPLALGGPDHEAHVAEEHHEQRVDEVLPRHGQAGQGAPDQPRGEQPEDAADQRADEVVAGDGPELPLEEDEARGGDEAEEHPHPGLPLPRAVGVPAMREHQDDDHADQAEPHTRTSGSAARERTLHRRRGRCI